MKISGTAEAIRNLGGPWLNHPIPWGLELALWDVVGKASTHTMHHYGQLLAIREGTPWAPPGAPTE